MSSIGRVRPGLTVVELLVVVAIISLLMAMLLPAVQSARETARRTDCGNNLKQIGLALHAHHDAHKAFPAGMYSWISDVSDAQATGFPHLLPYLEHDANYRAYDFKAAWFVPLNYEAVEATIKTFFCPSNRDTGVIDLTTVSAQWNFPLPPFVGSCDYAFCKGPNGSLQNDWHMVPIELRGAFGVRHKGESGLCFAEILDGTANTIALGDAAGGTSDFLVADLQMPGQPVIDPLTGQTIPIDQSWSAAGAGDPLHPWYGSVFAVTAQYGVGPDPADEPMNRRPTTPTVNGGDPYGDNRQLVDHVSGFRSLHTSGCNFLFCDGSVRFLRETIDSAVYRGLSTYKGGEVVPKGD